MKKHRIDRDTVIKFFDGFLIDAKRYETIRKPYSWALYQTWKLIDKFEKTGGKKDE